MIYIESCCRVKRYSILAVILRKIMFSSRNVLLATTVAAGLVVVLVHEQQNSQRTEMKKGVQRDKERIRAKRALEENSQS
jgi:predicted membrane protein